MKILKNQTASPVFIADVGQTVPASGQLTIVPSDYDKLAESSDVISLLANGTLIANDGNDDLPLNQGVWLILGSSPSTNFSEELKEDNRLKVEIKYATGSEDEIYKLKNSSNDTSAGFLDGKLEVSSGQLTKTVLNEGGNEDLELGLANTAVTPGSYGTASQVSSITVDSKGRLTTASNTPINITASQVSDFNESAQDAVVAALIDTTTIDFTYNDASNQITASVLPAGVNHNALQNYVANEHINHSAVNITAGVGLIGGGDITTSRTLNVNLPNFRVQNHTNTIQTTSQSMVVTDIVVPLTPGVYFIAYSCMVSATSNNRLVTTRLYLNGVEQTTTTSQGRIGSGGGLLGGLLASDRDQEVLSSTTVLTVVGNHNVDLRWMTSGGTAVMQQRQITAVRIG